MSLRCKKKGKPTLKTKYVALIFVIVFASCVTISFFFHKDNIKEVLCGYTTKNLPIYGVERSDKHISISFDCAWGNEYTDQLLAVMKEYNVKCTFFAVSFWVEKYPDEVKKIIDAGHEIGTHSKSHSYMSKQSENEIIEELEYSIKAIELASGTKVQLFRPPYGDYDNLLIDCAQKLGLYTIQWSVDSLDWKNLSGNEIAMRVISKVKSGSIILCHNNGLHTAESLPLIFADLQAKGYTFVKISDLIYKDGYKIANDGTQIKIN